MKTIAAIITPLGMGGIGTVRISGPDAFAVADRVFKNQNGKKIADAKGYTALFGKSYNNESLVDETVALVFKEPKSFTGEDSVELSVHGGSFVVKELLNAVLSAGARLAEPGEFTKRAFLNGKIDLTQAESVMGIITANSHQDLKMQQNLKEGAVSKKIGAIKNELILLAANIAAYSDYPDEDLPETRIENLEAQLKFAKSELKNLIANYNAGAVLKEGIKTVIAGKPNVGKSTLMNMLSGYERSIVTDIPGTTRDVIEQTVMLGEIPLKLYDTAGLHESDDTVENVGIKRAKECIDSAQLVLAVFDGSKPLEKEDKELLDSLKDVSKIAIINKTDMGTVVDEKDFDGIICVKTSAKLSEGYDKLVKAVAKISGTDRLNPDSIILGTLRQKECAQDALGSINLALDTMQSGFTIDAVGVCIDEALEYMLALTGERVTNEVTNEVFRRFCVGK